MLCKYCIKYHIKYYTLDIMLCKYYKKYYIKY